MEFQKSTSANNKRCIRCRKKKTNILIAFENSKTYNINIPKENNTDMQKQQHQEHS